MKNIMPPIYFFVLLVVSIIADWLFPIVGIFERPIHLLGFLLIIFGIVISTWVNLIFKRRKTTRIPGDKPSSLVIEGPFKISRHPMYLGMTAILLGVGILLGSLSALVGFLVFFVIMESVFIPMEEEILEDKFRKRYREYRNKVRRWI